MSRTYEVSGMRVLVVDDHEVVRRGMITLLQCDPDCVVCGEAVNGQDAVDQARALHPDVVVMDISMPVLNGLEATRLIRSSLPGCEVLILSQHDQAGMVRQAFKAGARGYVIKSSVSQNLLAAVQKVSRHESFFDPAIAEIATPLDLQEVLQRSAALEQALIESEQLYRNTFELAAIGVAHVSPDGRWLRVNQRVCDITGYSEAELLQARFQDITHPDDLAADLLQTDKLVRGELSTFSMEKRYVRKDGSQVWVNLTVSCARDVAGNLKHFISIIEDIGDRREAGRTRGRLAAIVESSDDAIISKDLNGVITSWNAGAARIFGYSAEEVIGRSITILIPTELRAEENEILRRLRSGERIDHFETIRLTKAGKRLNISLSISPIRDATGHIVGASKIARDITERKRVEEALHDSQTQLALALESSRTAIFDWDVVNRRGRWNSQMTALYNFTPAGEFVTPDEWRGLFHPDDVPRLLQEAEIATRSADKFQFEFRTSRSAQKTKWILSQGRIVRDPQGRALRMIGTHTDITDRKQAEEVAKVREIAGHLLQAQDAERRRIARDLHDSAGQLIAALQMHLQPMETDAETLDAAFAHRIRQSLDLLQQLSQELRTVSYLLHPPLLDQLGLSSALRWYTEGFAERSKIKVQLEVSPELGRLLPEIEMTLFRIVQESLTNIHRHSGSGRAEIRVLRSAQEVRLEVQDYGKGMPSAHGNGSPSLRKSGVGIRGMRERVLQLNGQFHVQSTPDGTTITARFPLSVPSLVVA
jgi:PAS domain S-box-containing protein